MPNFAIYEDSIILNVIIADSKEIAEEITGLNAIETEGSPWISWTLEEEGWRSPQPYLSWSWNNNEWTPPVPMPEDDNFWIWNEELQSWEEFVIPTAE